MHTGPSERDGQGRVRLRSRPQLLRNRRELLRGRLQVVRDPGERVRWIAAFWERFNYLPPDSSTAWPEGDRPTPR
jgi:hypothetical protein